MDSNKDEKASSSVVVDELKTYVVDKALEHRLLRKLDLHVLPAVSIMYFFNTIDKGNLANAKTDGLEADLNLTGNQYNLLLSLFYIPFVLCGPPMNLLTKRFGAHVVLPSAMIIFGGMAMLSAACTGFGGLVTTRWLLGMVESGFYPGVIFYLTTFYTRRELAGRLSIYYAASELSSAFTGLIAYGVFQIRSALKGWQYLFLIEGSLTITAGIVSLFVLPKSSATAYFLTPEEKQLAYHRMSVDSSTVVDAKFSFRSALRVFLTNGLWPFYMALSFCLVPQYSVQNFLPEIVARLGFGTVKTNLYTVAPNVVGSLFLMLIAFSSDYIGDRALHLAGCFSLSFTGFIVLAAVDVTQHVAVGYFCCFLLCCGAYISSPLLYTWFSNNIPGENERALLTGVLVASGNSMGLISSNIFLDKDAPRYTMASIISAAFAAAGTVMTLALGAYMKWDNVRRDKRQGVKLRAGDVPTAELEDGQRDPNWRWMGGFP